MRYLLASAMRGQDRPKEALAQVLELLRGEHARREKAPERWTYWQRKAGNEFANDFYQKNDFLSALTIYQALAKLSGDADWQWPAIYQMGLCFERLQLTERAAEAYKYLLQDAEKPNRKTEKIGEAAKALPAMAEWRGKQLAWRHDTGSTLEKLIGTPLYRGEIPAAPLASAKPAPLPAAGPAPGAKAPAASEGSHHEGNLQKQGAQAPETTKPGGETKPLPQVNPPPAEVPVAKPAAVRHAVAATSEPAVAKAVPASAGKPVARAVAATPEPVAPKAEPVTTAATNEAAGN
jgi:hypothetical protein